MQNVVSMEKQANSAMQYIFHESLACNPDFKVLSSDAILTRWNASIPLGSGPLGREHHC